MYQTTTQSNPWFSPRRQADPIKLVSSPTNITFNKNFNSSTSERPASKPVAVEKPLTANFVKNQ